MVVYFFFVQGEDGIRGRVRSRGLGDVYKRQGVAGADVAAEHRRERAEVGHQVRCQAPQRGEGRPCLLYTSDAADERSSVDLGGRRIIKKKTSGSLGRDTRSRLRKSEHREYRAI